MRNRFRDTHAPSRILFTRARIAITARVREVATYTFFCGNILSQSLGFNVQAFK